MGCVVIVGGLINVIMYMYTSAIKNYQTTEVVHSRNFKGIGVAVKIISPKSQPQLSQMTIGQYQLGKTKT